MVGGGRPLIASASQWLWSALWRRLAAAATSGGRSSRDADVEVLYSPLGRDCLLVPEATTTAAIPALSWLPLMHIPFGQQLLDHRTCTFTFAGSV